MVQLLYRPILIPVRMFDKNAEEEEIVKNPMLDIGDRYTQVKRDKELYKKNNSKNNVNLIESL